MSYIEILNSMGMSQKLYYFFSENFLRLLIDWNILFFYECINALSNALFGMENDPYHRLKIKRFIFICPIVRN